MLAIRNLSVGFGGLTALDAIGLDVGEGELFGLVGPNGSGKTTLINVLTGLYPAKGVVTFEGRNLLGLAPERIVGRGIVRTFQNLRVFERMTVLQNVLSAQNSLPGVSARDLIFSTGRGERERRAEARALVDAVGLSAHSSRLAGDLPLALQRRLELARALVRDPKLLLLDEPSGGMMPRETEEMTDLIRKHAAPGRSIILVEHKMAMIAALCQRMAVLNFGKVIAQGTPAEVLRAPSVIEAYMGRDA